MNYPSSDLIAGGSAKLLRAAAPIEAASRAHRTDRDPSHCVIAGLARTFRWRAVGLVIFISATALAPLLSAAELAPLTWSSTRPLMFPVPDAQHAIVAVKDPTVVYNNGKWQVFSTTADTNGGWSMEYRSFRTWEEATTAQPYYLDRNPNLRGYHCAPQVFYFRPQSKWYLIYQSQPPTYSTADDIEQPETWTAPQPFFQGTPASVVEGWIDYWIICDDTHAYLFFSDDHGRYYRSRTTLADFPRGFDEPVVIMREQNAGDLFEASCVYRLKDTNEYLCIIECMGGSSGHRYFRAFTASRLDGAWTPLPHADSWTEPFAGTANVTAADGGALWTADISHGELLRDGTDETMTIDPANLTFLYQGLPPNTTARDYSQLPWRLALLHANAAPPSDASRVVNISTRAECGAGNQVTIGGFVVTGSGMKRVLVRALGPALTAQGLGAGEVLNDPTIEVHDARHGNVVIAANDNWVDDPNLLAIRELGGLVGASAIPATDRTSSALVLTLPAGVYTVVAKGRNDTSGVVLVEVYEIDTASPMKFVNIASRAYSGTQNNVAIGGFVVSGRRPKQVLLRAVGPTLTTQGIATAEVLANPEIELHDAVHANRIVATNGDWGVNDNAASIVTEGARVGATPFAGPDIQSAALLMTLQPGVYSFLARGTADTAGVVLVEVYDAD